MGARAKGERDRTFVLYAQTLTRGSVTTVTHVTHPFTAGTDTVLVTEFFLVTMKYDPWLFLTFGRVVVFVDPR